MNLFELIGPFRNPAVTAFFLFITKEGLALFLIGTGLVLVLKRKYSLALISLTSITVAWLTAEVLKKIFAIPRPHSSIIETPESYSFPSGHAAVAFALWPFTANLQSWLKWLFRGVLVLFPLSRIYLEVHYGSDILAGVLVGLAIGYYLLAKEQQYHWTKTFFKNLQQELEFRRQIGHLVIGLSIVALLYFKIIDSAILAMIVAGGGIISLILKRKKIPVLTRLLETFERKEDLEHFPGKGSFFLVLGATFATLIFPEMIALGAITIMAVGDSIATLIGKYVGKIRFPFHKEKSFEGSLTAFFVSTLAASLFVPFPQAMIASLMAMTVESLPLKIGKIKIDDNLVIPIVAGVVMSLS